jgi:hypothetical protein
MDNAVAIVQAYLRLNGYFTVTEFPIIESMRDGGHRVATDLDVLAFRFPGAARVIPKPGRSGEHGRALGGPDPALGLQGDEADMIVAEVKEGRAELNRGARDPAVLRAVLTRFGCCEADEAASLVERLIRHGATDTRHGHRVRLMAFGSSADSVSKGYHTVRLDQVASYVTGYLRRHWSVLHHAEFKDPALGLLAMLMKAGVRWTTDIHGQGMSSRDT